MIKKCEEVLYKACQIVTSIALIAMVVLTVSEIFARQILDTSLLIVDEYCGYLMVVLAYWGAACAFLNNEFVRVDALFDRLSDKAKRIANFIFTILFAAMNGFVFRYALENTLKTIRRGDVAATISQTPLAYPKMMMVLGLVFLELVLIFRIIEFFQKDGNNENLKGEEKQ